MNICYSSPGWYIAYTAPRAEAKAADGIRALGRDVYLPIERRRVYRRGRRLNVTDPLFSRYVFFSLDPLVDEWSPIKHVDGVEDVLCNNDRPSRVPTAAIDRLRMFEQAGAFDRTTYQVFKLGERVRVKEGPFANMQGQIDEFVAKMKSATASKRVKVLMDYLARVELDVEALEKV